MIDYGTIGVTQTVSAPRFAELVRSQLREDNYGKDWCLTDLLRIKDAPHRESVLDVLRGLEGGRMDSSMRYSFTVTIKTCDGKPFVVTGLKQTGATKWVGKDAAGNPIYNGSPRAIKRMPIATIAPSHTCNLIGDTVGQSALWLLSQHGYMARHGGDDQHRWSLIHPRIFVKGKKDMGEAVAHDHWALVEQAFLDMHPEHDPFAADEDTADSAPTVAAAQPEQKQKRAYNRRVKQEN